MKILIPAYEPNAKLINLIDAIRQLTDTQIIVVNDGSGAKFDSIFDEISKNDVTVLTHEKNKGKGEALKTGITYMIDSGETEGFVSADCDGQHAPQDILKVIDELKSSNNDLVLGVRNFDEKTIPFRSKFGNKISKVLFSAMTGLKVSDTQTGLRGYSKNIFEALLEISGNRYDYEFNVLLAIKDEGFTYSEVKIQTIYENNNEVSHFRPIRDSILIYKPVCKFIVSSLSAAAIDFVLLLVFKVIFQDLLISVVLSRIISSIFNFTLNYTIVFKTKNRKKILHAITHYYALVLVIMFFNYSLLRLFNEILGVNLVIAKIITEVILYSFSFIMQKRFVFRKSVK